MNETLEFPPIEAPTAALAPASIKSAVLAQFADAERTVTALADKYRRVAYDCTTTKGMTDAKAARMDLRENGRYAVQRAESRVKSDVNDLKRVMADEVERIVGIVRPVEDAIDQQIKAEEARREAERQERERQAAEAARIEAERRQRHEDGITTLAGYVAKARGKTAAKMADGIAFVEKIQIDPSHWEEYAERAAETLARTLETLRDMHAAQVKAEADAAELEALRREKAERERRRAEEELAAARAESERLAREHAELEAERIAQLEAGAPKPQDAELVLAEAPIQPVAGGDIKAVAPDSEMTAAWNLPPRIEAAAPAAPAAAQKTDELEPTITIGDISARLGFIVTADFVIGLGFKRQVRIGRGVHFLASDWPRLCDAIAAHVQAMRGAT